jgi:probable HAF family extracellular repeat protein
MLTHHGARCAMLLCFLICAFVAGCDDDPHGHSDLECGPNGDAHGDHCDCDDGYVEENGTCVPGTPPPPDCGEHGTADGDHCHCDDGYVEEEGTCVPVAIVPCGQGHRHGTTCVCYAGHIYDATADSCVPYEVGPQPAIAFVIVPLGEPNTSSGINAVNDHLQVTGNKRPPGQTYLSAYGQQVVLASGVHVAGPITDLGILPHSTNLFSRPWDINWYGVVVGESGNSNPILPFLYDPGIGLRKLRLPPNATSAVAHGLNDDGVIVGISGSRAVRWASPHAVPTYLAPYPSATNPSSRAWKVNAQGDIVGHARTAAGQQRATWWKPAGDPVDLGTLNPAHISEAFDVNASGQIIGKSFVGVVPGSTSGTLQAQAFLYSNGSMRGLGVLPSLPAAVHSIANGINDNGWVVGQVEQIAGLAARAVLWREGAIEDLNAYVPANSGWVLTSAVAINEHGDIVGRGTLNGVSQPFVLVRVQ